ncbi:MULTISPECIES: DUF1453 domain-containing protein [Amycolatopsis]|uniref:DUF1453 domain-containing protein n=2 Tax=Amycolatopsis TaxID=1813 RepID=A0A1I3JWB7_9PSEU|nr:DUF1453 domain-containing protein [Amycolatopsis sacchari]SFI64474.1 hypothetical protein SAMN05421835_101303 [Amycolatopsis sacchari]
MSGPVEIVLVIAVIGYVLVRRLLGEPAEAKRLLVLPAILVVVGITDLAKEVHSPAVWAFTVASGLLSVAIGVARGASIRVFQRDGIAFLRYTAVTVVLLVATVVAKFGANVLFGLVDRQAAGAVPGNSLMLTLGLSLLAEGVIVLAKAVRGEGRIIWQRGRNGAGHRTAPWLDDLQRRYSGRDAR